MNRDTRHVSLGPCDCPNTPHGEDWAQVYERLTAGDLRRINASSVIRDADSFGLPDAMLLWRSIASWSKTDEQGQPIPISLEAVDDLSPAQASAVLGKLQPVLPQFLAGIVLPNPFGGPSADGPAAPTPISPRSARRTSPTRTAVSASR